MSATPGHPGQDEPGVPRPEDPGVPRPDEPGVLRPDEQADPRIRQEATASGQAHVTQVARDQHQHYYDRTRSTLRTTSGTVAEECPYPGLAAFGREQARWFFGRDKPVADLIGALDRRARTGGLQMVIAPSGAGKSSLIHAGLLPALDGGALPGSAHWPHIVCTPTATPLTTLTSRLARAVAILTGADPAPELIADPGRVPALLGAGQRVLIVVDQFEELFTMGAGPAERSAFIDLLAGLAAPCADGGPAAHVVIGLRADFYAACTHYRRLHSALRDNPLVVAAMTEQELRETIRYPAADVGLDLEEGIIELLLRDLGATGAADTADTGGYEAGRLPLLAHALRRSWHSRNGSTLTVGGYQATGGIQGAIAATAEEVYSSLDAAGQAVARLLFLRLVKIGDGTEDTRRRLLRTEAAGTGPDPGKAAAVMDAFTRERLLTQDHHTVEITHEALLHSWPRLRGWTSENRADRLTHQDLVESAGVWDRGGRQDLSLLFRGTRLEATRSWAAGAPDHDLTPAARAFLDASVHRQRRSQRRRTGVLAVLSVLTVLAVTAAVVAVQQQRKAVAQQVETGRQRDLAVYHRVLAEADRLRGTDVSMSAQLSLLAHRMRPGNETYTRLLTAGNTALSTPLAGHDDTVFAAAYAADGRTLATGGYDRTIRLWDMSGPRPVPLGKPLTGHASTVSSLAFSPDGRTLASVSRDQTVRLWDLSDPAAPAPLGKPLTGHDHVVYTVAFSPDGRTLASAGWDRTIRLWDVSDRARPRPLGRPLTGHADTIAAVAFSPDGRTLASASADRTVRLWNVARRTPLGTPLTGHRSYVMSVAFSPDGTTLAAAGDDRTIRLWDVPRRTPLGAPLTGHTNRINALAFGPDGRTLASGAADDTVRLWNLSDRARPVPLGVPLTGHTGAVNALAFSSDGRTLASGGGDRVLRVWQVHPLLTGHTGNVTSVAFSPDGRILASVGDDRTIRIWNGPEPLGEPLTGGRDGIYVVAFSPDGKTLAGAGGDGLVRLWDVSDPARPRLRGRALSGHTGVVYGLAFHPDGRRLASAADDNTIRLWDLSRRVPLGKPLRGHGNGIHSLAFSPDGRTLASAAGDQTLRLWKVSGRGGAAPLGRPLTGHIGLVLFVAYSPDGRTLASGSDDQTVRLWDVSDPARPAALGSPLTGHTGPVFSVAFSPDGRRLASGGGDHAVRLWDVSRPAEAAALGQPLAGHTGPVHDVRFSPHGAVLSSGGADQTVRLWTTDAKSAARRICTSTGDTLTRDAWLRYVGEDVPYAPPCRT
ncbi:hypothetical protein ITP53_31675 [Nonomuraea sp. K274]|uniref:Novel STAND NTPase 1 domain-containing protein n=1 Tax=Nonomuraea cypriaca TaxID=1187855 RepID=A0A931F221_9ACTN|nr:hypothetical protein [Nonomuraea cypriaca]MBF8190207.1 hypothetical protein [Nonomuraea cypriaca]